MFSKYTKISLLLFSISCLLFSSFGAYIPSQSLTQGQLNNINLAKTNVTSTDVVAAGGVTFSDSRVQSALARHTFIGAADLGNTTFSGRGVITIGTAGSQQVLAPFFFGPTYNKGPAQPEAVETFINGLPTLQVFTALFSGISIEMTNYMISATSRDGGVTWNQVTLAPQALTTTAALTVSNYYQTNISVTISSAFENGEPTFIYDRASGTNYLCWSYCPAQSQNNQTIWSAPFLDVSNSILGTPVLTLGITGAGQKHYDPHFYYDVNGILTMEVVTAGTLTEHYTNALNAMSSTVWIRTVNGLAGLQLGTGIATNYYIERPNTRYVTSGTNGVYLLSGSFTMFTNGFNTALGGYQVNGISVSLDNINWSLPTPIAGIGTNLFSFIGSQTNQININGLKLFEVSDDFSLQTTSELVPVPVIDSSGIQGLSWLATLTGNGLSLQPLSAVAVSNSLNTYFTLWANGNYSGNTNTSSVMLTTNVTVVNTNLTINQNSDINLKVGTNSMFRMRGFTEDGGDKNGNLELDIIQNGTLTQFLHAYSSGVVNLYSTAGNNFQIINSSASSFAGIGLFTDNGGANSVYRFNGSSYTTLGGANDTVMAAYGGNIDLIEDNNGRQDGFRVHTSDGTGDATLTGIFTATNGIVTCSTNDLIFTSVSALTNTLGHDATASLSAGTSVVWKDRYGRTIDTIGTVATLHVLITLRANEQLSGTAISATLH